MFITALNREHNLPKAKKEYTTLLISHRKTKRVFDRVKLQLQDTEYLIQQSVLKSYYAKQQRLQLQAKIK